eukprot:TRINITY_DN2482_c0_g1_i10.p1 TRINITY_DN2482_c0_g1~~TRINITY_DN2482_c0_g1_i10.p1  ORF type:complete len:167 (-),score=8.36 TRINITY_DN2482_c0_g1_i10:341-841(-)
MKIHQKKKKKRTKGIYIYLDDIFQKRDSLEIVKYKKFASPINSPINLKNEKKTMIIHLSVGMINREMFTSLILFSAYKKFASPINFISSSGTEFLFFFEILDSLLPPIPCLSLSPRYMYLSLFFCNRRYQRLDFSRTKDFFYTGPVQRSPGVIVHRMKIRYFSLQG